MVLEVYAFLQPMEGMTELQVLQILLVELDFAEVNFVQPLQQPLLRFFRFLPPEDAEKL